MNIPQRSFLLLVTACVLAGAAAAAPPPRIAQELPASSLTLPATPAGILEVQACRTCPTLTYRTSARTRLRINEEEVPLAILRQALLAHPDAITLVELTPNRAEVKQIVLASNATN